MNLAIICNILDNIPVGIIGVEKETGDIGYITNNDELNKVIDIILNSEVLELAIEEEIGDSIVVRSEKLDTSNSHYLVAFNYYLPHPWRILGVKQVEGELEKVIEESFEYMEGLK